MELLVSGYRCLHLTKIFRTEQVIIFWGGSMETTLKTEEDFDRRIHALQPLEYELSAFSE
jgi:hypothetical protein